MTDTASPYADWKAPTDDGQTLLWPEPEAILRDTSVNAVLLRGATHVRLQNIPLPELRQAAKKYIGHESDAPLISTGHQVELYHPGVWVKDALAHAVAAKVGGKAYHFAVDTDAPKHLHLRWPGGSEAITDDEQLASAASIHLLSNPTPRHLKAVEKHFGEAAGGWDFKPSIGPFFDALRKTALGEQGLAKDLAAAQHKADWDLGLRYHQLIASPLWTSPPYLTFAHHLLAGAEQFAAAYNASLADYRRANGVRTASRPMPDLAVDADSVEVPFWLDDLGTGGRSRLSVKVEKGVCYFTAPGGERFALDPALDGWKAAARLQAFCRKHNLWVVPRAMTLTMFFRLILSDLFIHGIGGGRYDQVTDAVIQKHFRVEAPRFAVTTATLYFPTAAGQRRVNLRPLLQEGRRIRHGMLSTEKRSLVAAIDALPRRSPDRRELFFRMHARLAAESNRPEARSWEQRLVEARHESLAQKSLFDRELFYAIQPRERLVGLIDHYARAFE